MTCHRCRAPIPAQGERVWIHYSRVDADICAGSWEAGEWLVEAVDEARETGAIGHCQHEHGGNLH